MAQVRNSLIVVLAAFLPLASYAQSDSEPAPQGQPVFVKTMRVPPPQQNVTRQFFGQVAALDTVDISFEVGGKLTLLEAQEGAFVRRGALLAQLDLSPFQRAVERAELTLAQTERDLARARTLAERNVASTVQAEDAETARDLADVALREARDALEDATITAPFDALVADRLGTAFTNVEPGAPILRLHNLSEIRVEFDLPERLLSTIGDPAEVTFTGQFTGHDGTIPLTFREFRAETTGVGQSYTLSLAAPPVAGLRLLPGRTTTVHASVPQRATGIVLPQSAIAIQADGRHTVAVLSETDDGFAAQHVDVTVQSTNGTGFTVTGLAPGTEIVALGAHLIADGQPVARFTRLTQEGS